MDLLGARDMYNNDMPVRFITLWGIIRMLVIHIKNEGLGPTIRDSP